MTFEEWYGSLLPFERKCLTREEAFQAGTASRDAEIAELVEALRYLAEAILTKADADYTRRQMDEAVRVMELHGITMPVPYALAKASKP